ncbi:MAG: sugar porter family MFS transporter [Gammaproteobacteria bacterium]|nr:sugar porter family MFS transporter [Gammaproteobacteria bacterium]
MSLIFWIITCASIGGFLYGYDLGVFPGSIYSIQKEIDLTVNQIDISGGAVFMGGLIGTLITGYLSDRFGRRIMISVGSILFITGVLLTLAIASFYEFLFSRIVLGIAIGVITVAIPSYLSEISPTRIRGRSVVVFQIFLTIGILLAYIVDSILAPSGHWQEMYLIILIPATLLFLSIFFLPESPRWLMTQNREEEALKILNMTRPKEEAASDLIAMKSAHKQDQRSRWRDLFNRRVALPLTIVLVVAVLNQLTAINSILIYAPAVFNAAGIKGTQNAIDASIFIGLINFIATILAACFADKLSRRLLMMLGTGGVTLSYLFLALVSHFSASPTASLIGILCFIFCFAVGPGALVWLILTELLPTGVRGKGLSIALFANSMTSWAVASVFFHVNNMLGMTHTYLLLAFFTLCYFIISWRLIPETTHHSLEEIQKAFSTRKQKHVRSI